MYLTLPVNLFATRHPDRLEITCGCLHRQHSVLNDFTNFYGQAVFDRALVVVVL